MIVLVLNCGSSSVKYQVFDIDERREMLLGQGLADRVGIAGSSISHQSGGKEAYAVQGNLPNHEEAIGRILGEVVVHSDYGCLRDIERIEAVGHRVVHGGERFREPVLVGDGVKCAITEYQKFAPLHNPANLNGILACERLLPNVPQVAVFDTAFHSTMPPAAYLYAIPRHYYEEHGIRRYGFHGISHAYVAGEATRVLASLGKSTGAPRLVTCHLGNGCSVAAIKGGVCIDTSMGFTPLEGLVMGTRSGDLDPAIILYLSSDLAPTQIGRTLNEESGMKGLTGFSDLRDVLAAAAGAWDKLRERRDVARLAEGEKETLQSVARDGLAVYTRRVRKYIGAYTALMNGLDGVVFTAGVGERSPEIRAMILEEMGWIGLELDPAANASNSTIISTPTSKVAALVIPTNEELVIARETHALVHAARPRDPGS